MTHTPTPWTQDVMDILNEDGTQIATTSYAGFLGNYSDEDNAAHIVRCVNLHDELVEALKQSLELANIAEGMTGCKSDDEYVWGIQETIRIALKKAGAL